MITAAGGAGYNGALPARSPKLHGLTEPSARPIFSPSPCSWNFTPAPGWTKEEAQILKLCLMKHGVGRWIQILETGLLPGKLIQQLNGQTQRLLGQQSLAAFTGLQVDIDRIRADNDKLVDAERKNGLVINSGRECGRAAVVVAEPVAVAVAWQQRLHQAFLVRLHALPPCCSCTCLP